MAHPLDPLRHLTETKGLRRLDDVALETRAVDLTKALKDLPDLHHNLRVARQAVLVELHTNRRRSFADLGRLIEATRGRAKQIVDGHIGRPAREKEGIEGDNAPDE